MQTITTLTTNEEHEFLFVKLTRLKSPFGRYYCMQLTNQTKEMIYHKVTFIQIILFGKKKKKKHTLSLTFLF